MFDIGQVRARLRRFSHADRAMQLVALTDRLDEPACCGRMDKEVARRGASPRARIGLVAALLALLAASAYLLAPGADSQTVESRRLTIAAVSRGQFEDFLPLRGRVTPSVTVFLDAVEGGRVAPALLLPNGAFVKETGGNWVFVVAPDGRSAVRRKVRLGRRNAMHVEVLEGLDPGERVITSAYTGFAERERLELTQ